MSDSAYSCCALWDQWPASCGEAYGSKSLTRVQGVQVKGDVQCGVLRALHAEVVRDDLAHQPRQLVPAQALRGGGATRVGTRRARSLTAPSGSRRMTAHANRCPPLPGDGLAIMGACRPESREHAAPGVRSAPSRACARCASARWRAAYPWRCAPPAAQAPGSAGRLSPHTHTPPTTRRHMPLPFLSSNCPRPTFLFGTAPWCTEQR